MWTTLSRRRATDQPSVLFSKDWGGFWFRFIVSRVLYLCCILLRTFSLYMSSLFTPALCGKAEAQREKQSSQINAVWTDLKMDFRLKPPQDQSQFWTNLSKNTSLVTLRQSGYPAPGPKHLVLEPFYSKKMIQSENYIDQSHCLRRKCHRLGLFNWRPTGQIRPATQSGLSHCQCLTK